MQELDFQKLIVNKFRIHPKKLLRRKVNDQNEMQTLSNLQNDKSNHEFGTQRMRFDCDFLLLLMNVFI